MRKRLSILLLLLLPLVAGAQTTNVATVTYSFANFTQNPANVRRLVLMPLPPPAGTSLGTNIGLPSQKIFSVAGNNGMTNGFLVVSNVTVGMAWAVQVSDNVQSYYFTNYFPLSDAGTTVAAAQRLAINVGQYFVLLNQTNAIYSAGGPFIGDASGLTNFNFLLVMPSTTPALQAYKYCLANGLSLNQPYDDIYGMVNAMVQGGIWTNLVDAGSCYTNHSFNSLFGRQATVSNGNLRAFTQYGFNPGTGASISIPIPDVRTNTLVFTVTVGGIGNTVGNDMIGLYGSNPAAVAQRIYYASDHVAPVINTVGQTETSQASTFTYSGITHWYQVNSGETFIMAYEFAGTNVFAYWDGGFAQSNNFPFAMTNPISQLIIGQSEGTAAQVSIGAWALYNGLLTTNQIVSAGTGLRQLDPRPYNFLALGDSTAYGWFSIATNSIPYLWVNKGDNASKYFYMNLAQSGTSIEQFTNVAESYAAPFKPRGKVSKTVAFISTGYNHWSGAMNGTTNPFSAFNDASNGVAYLNSIGIDTWLNDVRPCGVGTLYSNTVVNLSFLNTYNTLLTSNASLPNKLIQQSQMFTASDLTNTAYCLDGLHLIDGGALRVALSRDMGNNLNPGLWVGNGISPSVMISDAYGNLYGNGAGITGISTNGLPLNPNFGTVMTTNISASGAANVVTISASSGIINTGGNGITSFTGAITNHDSSGPISSDGGYQTTSGSTYKGTVDSTLSGTGSFSTTGNASTATLAANATAAAIATNLVSGSVATNLTTTAGSIINGNGAGLTNVSGASGISGGPFQIQNNVSLVVVTNDGSYLYHTNTANWVEFSPGNWGNGTTFNLWTNNPYFSFYMGYPTNFIPFGGFVGVNGANSFGGANNQICLKTTIFGNKLVIWTEDGTAWYKSDNSTEVFYSAGNSSGHNIYWQFTWPTFGRHTINFHYLQDGIGSGIVAVYWPVTNSMVATPKPTQTIIVMGDSFTDGAFGVLGKDSVFGQLQDILEPYGICLQLWGEGGTGYLYGGNGGNGLAETNFLYRITNNIIAFPPNGVIWAGGFNDVSNNASWVTTSALFKNATNCFGDVATSLPNCKQIGIGAWCDGYNSSNAWYVNKTLSNAAAVYGIPFIYPAFTQPPAQSGYVPWVTGIWSNQLTGNAYLFNGGSNYTDLSGTHPSFVGAKYIAQQMANFVLTNFVVGSTPIIW